MQTWMDGNNTFDKKLWNHEHESLRANHHVEGHNLKLDKELVTSGPTIWKLIEFLQVEELELMTQFDKLVAGTLRRRGCNGLRRRGCNQIARDLEITTLKLKFSKNEIDVRTLLDELNCVTPDF